MVAVILAGLSELPGGAAGIASSLIAVVFISTTVFLFRRTPECQAKHEKVILLKNRRSDSSKANREVVKLEAAKRDINNREKKAVDKLTKQVDKARVAEQKELAAVDATLAKQIQKFEKQKQSLQANEARETANALRLLQDQYVSSYLRGSAVSSARIPGIGPGVIRSLAANGIITAADFTGIAYSAGPRGGTRQVMISLRNGGYVHPSGVGQKKADDLDAWRRSHEMRARASQPSALPSAQAQAISVRYVQHRQTLANQEQSARAQASAEQSQISQRWISARTPISTELAATRLAFAKERAETDAQQIVAKKYADATVWKRDLAAREVTAYRGVSYRRYLAEVIGS
jgi:DNA-binding helix-hairpin-helix protein with protein kinase domain